MIIIGFLKKVKKKLYGKHHSQKCDKCNNPATRTTTTKDGKDLHLCSNCYILLQLIMMVENRVFEKTLLERAFQQYRHAQGAKDFIGAVISFEEIIAKIEDLIEEYHLRILSSSEEEAAKSYLKLITDFLDVLAEVHDRAGRSSFLANRFSPASPTYTIAIEHFIKAIQNKLPFRYGSPGLEKEINRWARESGKAKDMPLLEIPRPVRLLQTSKLEPMINFNELASKLGQADGLMLLNTYVRYQNDIVWFAGCYHLLGQSLMKFGLLRRGGFLGRSSNEIHKRKLLLERLQTNVFSHAEEVYRLALWCIEKLPISDVTYNLRKGYGTGLFDLGICLFKQARFQESLELFKKALEIYSEKEKKWPAPPNSDVGKADCQLYSAKCYLMLNEKKAAMHLAKIALEMSKKLYIQDNVKEAEHLLERLS